MVKMILFKTTKPLQRRNLSENPKKIFVQKKDGRQEQGKLKEVIDTKKEVVNLEDEVEGNTYEQAAVVLQASGSSKQGS